MIPSQKAGIAKLSVKNTREPWSSAPPRCSPAQNPIGSEITAAITAAYTTRNRVGGMWLTITVVAGWP